MGTSYSAKIVVGLPFCAILNAQELLDGDKLRDFSYYYDCCEDDRIVGVEVTGSGSYSYSELDDTTDLHDYIDKALWKFNRETGLDGKTYLTVCSY